MDTNRLKKFAIEARNILKAGIAAKLTSLGFDSKGGVAENLRPQLLQGGTLWNGRTFSEGFYHQWMHLYEEVQAKGVNEVYEQAAYTWFNRLVAIRILQKNGLCEPVSTYADSAHTPQIVNQARQGLFPPMEEASKRHLLELLDDDTKVTEQFAVLLVAWCHANPILQRCFGTMEDYTELLLPANILAENGFIHLLNHTEFITDEEFRSPELIGWLYQFYISERKDEVFAKKGKFEADEIPAATQIFTPNWIVKYMVQNTVGRIYLDNNPYVASVMKSKWQYLVESVEPTPADAVLHYDELTDFKVADLACGSGHILNECFDLLYDLYITEGYTRTEAITHIFQYNLTGIDLDPRAQQLSLFALTLKACQCDRSFVDAHCLPRVLTMPKVQLPLPADTRLAVEIDAANSLLKNADSLGSIMKFDLTPTAREWVTSLAEENEAAALVIALTEQYDVLVMNPPYMGANHMEELLLNYSKKYYENTCNDLGAIFMDVAYNLLVKNGKFGMINQAAWLFKPAYKEYRLSIIKKQQYNLENVLYLGPNAFPELKGEVVQSVSFIVSKSNKRDCIFYYLKDGQSSDTKMMMFKEKICKTFIQSLSEFILFEGCQFGFWIKKHIKSTFHDSPIRNYGDAKQGLKTGDNAHFIKLWYEISKMKFNKKWYPVETGGNYRKWYGNGISVLNWENDGYEIKNFKNENGKLRSRPQGLQYSFKEGITWSTSAGDKPSFRLSDNRYLFESSGSKFFLFEDSSTLPTYCAYLNSYVVRNFIEMLSPGIGVSEGAIKTLPYIIPSYECNILATMNIAISKIDWDVHETSWDFQQNELISLIDLTEQDITTESLTALFSTTTYCDAATPQTDNNPHTVRLQDLMDRYHHKWSTFFMQLHVNEEELNRQFIDIYDLQDELTPDVPLNEITILQQGEVSIEGNALKWHDEVILKQLLSYAVGVWMGRYRLDKPGLHIAHPNPTAEELAPYTYNGHTIEIDDDGIFPLMAADSGFTDNACLRTAQFVSDVFGVEYQVENLNYIEHTLGKTIEQYWQKDFWQDHKKMYQNRPIYWLFASKKGTFQCIAYLHRITPYTPERIRSKYLLPFIETLGRKIADLTTRAADLSTAERKKLDTLNKQLEECREYHDRLAVVAEQAIPLDLDDGVVVNYAKLGDVLQRIK